jgi:hypothetical protein
MRCLIVHNHKHSTKATKVECHVHNHKHTSVTQALNNHHPNHLNQHHPCLAHHHDHHCCLFLLHHPCQGRQAQNCHRLHLITHIKTIFIILKNWHLSTMSSPRKVAALRLCRCTDGMINMLPCEKRVIPNLNARNVAFNYISRLNVKT